MGQIIQLKTYNDTFNLQVSKLINLCQEDLESINTLILEKLDSKRDSYWTQVADKWLKGKD